MRVICLDDGTVITVLDHYSGLSYRRWRVVLDHGALPGRDVLGRVLDGRWNFGVSYRYVADRIYDVTVYTD